LRILVLGGDGMLGHALMNHLRDNHEVVCTLRQDFQIYDCYELFTPKNAYAGIDVRNIDSVAGVFSDFRPDALLNCTGIVKQRAEAQQSIPSLEINSLLPHKLAELCKATGVRLVHFSTDCVFSGNRGNYREGDFSDANDLYGRTKFLGEVGYGNSLTLRTSIIGRELARKAGLLEWFLAQTEQVRGFTNAIYSGFTTLEMSRIVEFLLVKHPAASGLYQVSSEPISKYDLLVLLGRELGHDIEIVPDGDIYCDRSLDSTRFRREFNYAPPSWEAMVKELGALAGE